MDLLKELFSFDDFEENNQEEEFDFDFDDESEELNFDDDSFHGYGFYEDEDDDDDDYDDLDSMGSDDDFGSEEDYPESMDDMPGMDPEDMEDEVEDIAKEIESLYQRLGKLAAAGDLNLYDDSLMGDEDDNEEFEDPEMGMGDEMPMDPEMGEDEFGGMGFDDEEEDDFPPRNPTF